MLRQPFLAVRIGAIGSAGLLAISALGSCSHDAATPDLCPTSGTYVMSVTIGGPYVTAPGIDVPLIDSASGSCGLATPSISCTPVPLTVTVTLEGARSIDGQTAQLQSIRWTTASGESGSCTDVYDETTGGSITGPDGTPVESSVCDLSAEGCTGTIDALGLTFDVSGIYGHAIAAGVSGGGCCWRGTAEMQ